MTKNIDEMTYSEIKEYVANLEEINEHYANKVCQYLDFMKSVETFEKEMRAWVNFYGTMSEESLNRWCKNTEPEQEDKLAKKHYEDIASEVASNSIAKLFDRFVKYPS